MLTITGELDDKNRWHGPVIIDIEDNDRSIISRELVTMVHGRRHGKSKHIDEYEKVSYTCYNMGKRVSCDKKSSTVADEEDAYNLLSYENPWYMYTLNAMTYTNEYVKAYIDTFELLLSNYDFEKEEFDVFYSNVQDTLEGTHYDSLMQVNAILSYALGKEELKNSELRLAVIDRFRSKGNSSFQIIKNMYPNYLLQLNDSAINDQDFEVFSFELDSIMDSYGSLDLQDPFFVDSVDNWLYDALSAIYAENQPYLMQKRILNNGTKIQSVVNQPSITYFKIKHMLEKTPAEVSSVVISIILEDFLKMDLFRQAIRKSYCRNNSIVDLPVVTTVFNGNITGNSSEIQGFVFEDGGSSISSRGIAWSDFYNPTINDQKETAGGSLGEFEITLSGLIEGKTYYARTYATNSSGTAYGNCIEFIAGSAVGINPSDPGFDNLNIYPNPASEILYLDFAMDLPLSPELKIFDNSGRLVFSKQYEMINSGDYHLEVDISNLYNGIYHLELSDGRKWEIKKVFILK